MREYEREREVCEWTSGRASGRTSGRASGRVEVRVNGRVDMQYGRMDVQW